MDYSGKDFTVRTAQSNFKEIDYAKYFVFLNDEVHYRVLDTLVHVLNAQVKTEPEGGKKFETAAETGPQLKSHESEYQWKCPQSFDTKELFHFIGKLTFFD